MLNKTVLLAAVAVAIITYPKLQVTAHSGAHPVRYVSASGTDNGVCDKASAPCKTIVYAVNQSSKGDEVRVAKGNYPVKGIDLFYLLSDMVVIKGGFSTDFKNRNKDKFLTSIIGIPGEYRKKLDKRGFHLLSDSKEFDIQLSIEDRKLLNQYKQMTTKIEGPAECVDGKALGYECHNIDLQSHMPLNEFSSTPSSANDIWGHTDLNNQKEYAIIGLRGSTAFVDISDPTNPIEVATIGGNGSTWRDIKVYQHFDNTANKYKAYAYVTTDKADQGMQIIDLSNLPTNVTLIKTLNDFSEAHNVFISNLDYSDNTALSGLIPMIYISGSNLNTGDEKGSYQIYNLTDPADPQLEANSGSGAGYIHDAASFVIDDARTASCNNHSPCEILIDFNAYNLDIWDITDKSAPYKIKNISYTTSDYIHSGWWSEDKMTIFIQNELDEQRKGVNTTLEALDISDLNNPQIIGTYVGQTAAIDHNGFTLGTEYYMSNYRRGLSLIDISDPSNMTDIGFFDTFSIPATNSANFNGAWGVYPYLPSGNVIVSDLEYGLFVLKVNKNDGEMPTTTPQEPDPEPEPEPVTSSSGGGSFGILALIFLGLIRRQF